jgi:hypothetical protein
MKLSKMNFENILLLLAVIVLIRYFIIWSYHYIQRISHRDGQREGYMDMTELNKSLSMLQMASTPNTVDANESFRKLVTYLEKNPTDAEKFLTYIQDKFFIKPCPLRDPSTWRDTLTNGADFRVFKISNEDEKKFTRI